MLQFAAMKDELLCSPTLLCVGDLTRAPEELPPPSSKLTDIVDIKLGLLVSLGVLLLHRPQQRIHCTDGPFSKSVLKPHLKRRREAVSTSIDLIGSNDEVQSR